MGGWQRGGLGLMLVEGHPISRHAIMLLLLLLVRLMVGEDLLLRWWMSGLR